MSTVHKNSTTIFVEDIVRRIQNGRMILNPFWQRGNVWDEKKLDYGAGADLDKVEMEDEEVVENVQKGVSSRFYKHGRFSPSMEQGVHHFHRLVSRFMIDN